MNIVDKYNNMTDKPLVQAIAIAIGAFIFMSLWPEPTPEEKAAKAAQAKREVVSKQIAKDEERRKGFHCLSSWDGSDSSVNAFIKERLRDPGSFEHIATQISPVDSKGKHDLLVQYRARNGFGGMTVSVAKARVANKNCQATITSLGE